MRIVVLGAGAVGGLLGWVLATGGAEVTLVRRSASTGAGLTVIDPVGRVRPVAVATLPLAEALSATLGGTPPDVVVCAVRLTDLPDALEALDAWPAVPLVTVQNGVGAEALALARRPGTPLVAASLTAAVARERDGAVRWLRLGGLALAPVAGPVGPLVAELVRRCITAGLPARALPDAAAMKWSKLLSNLLANASSAILDLDPAAIYRDPALFDLERRQVREALAVMAAQGLRPVDLPGAPVRLLALGMRLPAGVARPVLARVVGGARGGKSPSLRRHVAAGGGPSEGPWLNGAVVDGGAAAGVPTPVNAVLLQALDEVCRDDTARTWFAGHPERLLARLPD